VIDYVCYVYDAEEKRRTCFIFLLVRLTCEVESGAHILGTITHIDPALIEENLIPVWKNIIDEDKRVNKEPHYEWIQIASRKSAANAFSASTCSLSRTATTSSSSSPSG
jgi:hypothetical protein